MPGFSVLVLKTHGSVESLVAVWMALDMFVHFTESPIFVLAVTG